jgi:hypothetical protein
MPRNPSYLGSNSQAGSLKAVGLDEGDDRGDTRGSAGAVLVGKGRDNVTLAKGSYSPGSSSRTTAVPFCMGPSHRGFPA